ncbi:hypothetical protein NFI96_002656 [Prochilodus magdalenae]|nr:hypothetical protein NFI96_002656 [Prochilodus magdalenae]
MVWHIAGRGTGPSCGEQEAPHRPGSTVPAGREESLHLLQRSVSPSSRATLLLLSLASSGCMPYCRSGQPVLKYDLSLQECDKQKLPVLRFPKSFKSLVQAFFYSLWQTACYGNIRTTGPGLWLRASIEILHSAEQWSPTFFRKIYLPLSQFLIGWVTFTVSLVAISSSQISLRSLKDWARLSVHMLHFCQIQESDLHCVYELLLSSPVSTVSQCSTLSNTLISMSSDYPEPPMEEQDEHCQSPTAVNVSDQTIRNRPHEGGLRARHPVVGSVLTGQHLRARLAFATEHQNGQICHRRLVLFTDESRFYLSHVPDVTGSGDTMENVDVGLVVGQ